VTLVSVFCKLFVHDQYDVLVNVHRNFMNKHFPNFHSFNTTIVLSLIKSMEVCLIVQFQHDFYLNIFKTLYMNALVNFNLSFFDKSIFIICVLLKKEGNVTCECKIYELHKLHNKCICNISISISSLFTLLG